MAVGEVGQLYLPLFLACLLVKSDAAPVHGADEDHAMADRDAAAIGREQHFFGQRIEPWLIAPNLLPCLSVERRHAISRGGRIDHAIDHDGRLLNPHGDIAAMGDPRD